MQEYNWAKRLEIPVKWTKEGEVAGPTTQLAVAPSWIPLTPKVSNLNQEYENLTTGGLQPKTKS